MVESLWSRSGLIWTVPAKRLGYKHLFDQVLTSNSCSCEHAFVTIALSLGSTSPSVARRRLVLAVLTGVALLVMIGLRTAAVALLGSGPLSPPGQVHRVELGRVTPVSQAVYIVQPGDTLWRIARTVQPTGDVRPLVDRLAARQHGEVLRPGERVALP
jgi:hypothetical protein